MSAKKPKGMLDLLEELLSITEEFKDRMTPRARKRWQAISAKTADIREWNQNIDRKVEEQLKTDGIHVNLPGGTA